MILGGISICPASADAAAPKLSSNSLVLVEGSSYNLKLSGAFDKVLWGSSNYSSVDFNYVSRTSIKLEALKKGTATISAKVGSKIYRCMVKVIDARLNTTRRSMYKGNSCTLKVTGGTVKKWVSKNKSVAEVSSKGKVTAKKAGTVKILAYVGNSVLTCNITVMKKPSNYIEPTTKLNASIENGQHTTFDGLHLGDRDGYEEYCISGKHIRTGIASTTVPVYGGKVVDVRDKDMLVKSLRADRVVGAFYNNYIHDGMDDIEKLQAIFNYLDSKPSYLVGIKGYDCCSPHSYYNFGVVDEVPIKINSGCAYCQRQVQKDIKNGLDHSGYLANTAYAALYLHTATNKGWAQAFEMLCVAVGIDAFYMDVDQFFYPVRIKMYGYWVDIYPFSYREGKNANKYFNFSNGGDPYHSYNIVFDFYTYFYTDDPAKCQYKRLKNYNRYASSMPMYFYREGRMDSTKVILYTATREGEFEKHLNLLKLVSGLDRILYMDEGRKIIMCLD